MGKSWSICRASQFLYSDENVHLLYFSTLLGYLWLFRTVIETQVIPVLCVNL